MLGRDWFLKRRSAAGKRRPSASGHIFMRGSKKSLGTTSVCVEIDGSLKCVVNFAIFLSSVVNWSPSDLVVILSPCWWTKVTGDDTGTSFSFPFASSDRFLLARMIDSVSPYTLFDAIGWIQLSKERSDVESNRRWSTTRRKIEYANMMPLTNSPLVSNNDLLEVVFLNVF